MIALARLSIRRPRLALAVWLVLAAALMLVGLGVSRTLSPSITVVSGTESSRAQQLADAQFGPTQLVPILLEGPRAQLDRQGPVLVAALDRRARTRVLSAWDSGSASSGLRPSPTAAMIVVSVDRSEKTVVATDQPQIAHLVAARIQTPVRAFITGQPSIDRALRSASLSGLRSDELIAAAILFVLLLIGLRAPVAALLVTAVGTISMLAGFGEVAVLGHVMSLDPVGVALGTMTGLALGVGFALLILDRFHRERRPGADAAQTAAAAMRELQTTGRAVLVGGTAIVVALALAAVIGPSALMISLGTGMLACAAFATGGAVVVMPAALVLLGGGIDALRVPAPRPLSRAWSRLVDGGAWVTRRAVGVGFVATVLLAALAVPAFALRSGPPDVSQLPAGSPARIAFQEVSRVMGPGWATPYNLIVVARDRPLTTPALLAAVVRFQRQIASGHTVASVVGPGAIAPTSNALSTFGPQLVRSAKISDKSKRDLLTLIKGLGQAGAGSAKLRAGLAQAASGAGQLHGGSGRAQAGAGQLHTGLRQARDGSVALAGGLRQALAGAQALKTGAGQALTGSKQLLAGIGLAQGPAAQSVPVLKALSATAAATSAAVTGLSGRAQREAADVSAAVSALRAMGAGKGDPQYQAALSALTSAGNEAGGLPAAIQTTAASAAGAKGLAGSVADQAPGLVAALGMLHDGAASLQAGISQLHAGNSQLVGGIGKLSGGGGQLSSGLDQLTAGSAALEAGLTALTSGSGQLQSGLASGVSPAGQLTAGLATMEAAVAKSRGKIPSTAQLKQLQRESPGLFSSGYFVLAAVAGAQPSARTAASFTINLTRGGTAGQIVVVSRYAASDPRTVALGTRLVTLGRRFGAAQRAAVAVGGPAGSLGDLTSATRSRVWLDVAVLSLVIALVLGVALRAVVLPAVAVLFSLLVVAATFGILQILFGGVGPALGGPGYLDPMTIIGILSVAFPISVTWAALLLMRTREAYVAGGAGRDAIGTGLRETAAAATGAGVVMIAALVPFAATDLLNVRAFGIGVGIAILLDTVIVRPVLLPAAVAVLGRLGWWPTARGDAGRRGDGDGRGSAARVPALPASALPASALPAPAPPAPDPVGAPS